MWAFAYADDAVIIPNPNAPTSPTILLSPYGEYHTATYEIQIVLSEFGKLDDGTGFPGMFCALTNLSGYPTSGYLSDDLVLSDNIVQCFPIIFRPQFFSSLIEDFFDISVENLELTSITYLGVDFSSYQLANGYDLLSVIPLPIPTSNIFLTTFLYLTEMPLVVVNTDEEIYVNSVTEAGMTEDQIIVT